MPLFVCEKCNCVENTALGFYYRTLEDVVLVAKQKWEVEQ